MKDVKVIVFIGLVSVMMMSCSALGIETHDYEYARRKMEYIFKNTTYPMIDDEDIISITSDSLFNSATGKYMGKYDYVTFRYGANTVVWRYYMDRNGNVVKTKNLKKRNGFFRADSWLYTITSKGLVRFHYSFVIIVCVILYFEIKRFTV